jgi:hypothetical protein
MTREVGIAALLGTLVLGGCASGVGSPPSASPAFTPAAECERNGGWWRASMGVCEYEAPEQTPLRR